MNVNFDMSELESLINNFVGVVSPSSFQHTWYLKRLLLMFDKLALDLGQSSLSLVERRILEKGRDEIHWLSSKGLLTTLSGLVAQNTEDSGRNKQIPVFGNELLSPITGKKPNLMGQAGRLLVISTIGLRITASDLRSKCGVDAVAVPYKIEPENVDARADRDAVIRLVLRTFPSPSDSTSWEQINDYRQAETSRIEFSRLKHWINKTGRSGLKQYEVTDELQDLIHEYEQGMQQHKIKSNRGFLEVLVTTTAEIAEGIVKFNWSTAAKSIFSVSKHRIKLLEEEKKIKGRNISYIVNTNRAFS